MKGIDVSNHNGSIIWPSVKITRWIQQQLSIDTDGDFGSLTEEAGKTFQRTRGLLIDGVVGKETWRVLLNL